MSVYFYRGCEEDCHNDMNVLSSIKSDITAVIKKVQDLDNKKALAFNENTLLDIVDHLDDCIADIIEPKENEAEEGAALYDTKRNEGA